MKYNSQYIGQYYQLSGGEVYVLRGDGKFAYAGADGSSVVVVQLTGYYLVGADGKDMFQTTSGGWIRLADGWKNTGYAPIRIYTQKDAQYYVDKVIKANARILENNLLCARFSSKLNSDQQFTLYQLQKRLESRNKQLLDDGLCANQRVSAPPGYSLLDNSLNSFMVAYANGGQVAGLGAVSITIVVAAIAIASLATAAYFAYKYLASEAEKDVKYSDELTQVLMAKLTPEEYDQLMQETQGIVTKSKLLSKFSGALSVLKYGLLVAAGFVVYKVIKKYI